MILAHNYERPEVQDVADFVGRLARTFAGGGQDPGRCHCLLRRAFHGRDGGDPVAGQVVLLPDMAARVLARRDDHGAQLRAWKAEHPGAVVVSYVNTTAEVKAESDYCCTSGNAVDVVNVDPRRSGDPVPA